MGKLFFIVIFLFACGQPPWVPPSGASVRTLADLRDGDIVLQTSTSSQSQAIQLATHSKYSHVGVIVHRNGQPYVFEAHGPVGFRSLSAFISSGVGGHVLARRVRGGLNAEQLKLLSQSGSKFQGRPYDIYFNWDDSQIYCSEIVYKMFDRALNIKVGRTQELGSLDLSSPAVQAKLRERYGNNIPYHETVLTPAAIAEDSQELVTVYEN